MLTLVCRIPICGATALSQQFINILCGSHPWMEFSDVSLKLFLKLSTSQSSLCRRNCFCLVWRSLWVPKGNVFLVPDITVGHYPTGFWHHIFVLGCCLSSTRSWLTKQTGCIENKLRHSWWHNAFVWESWEDSSAISSEFLKNLRFLFFYINIRTVHEVFY